MFASNSPVDGLKGSWDYLYSRFKDATAEMPLSDRKKLFSENALRFYRVRLGGARDGEADSGRSIVADVRSWHIVRIDLSWRRWSVGVERSQCGCGSWGIGSIAHDPLPNSARAGRRSRKLTLPCCLSLAALRSRTIRVSLGAFDEVPEVSPREREGVKFCEECAAPLGSACAKCGRPDARHRSGHLGRANRPPGPRGQATAPGG
jgi:hypothetical protein